MSFKGASDHKSKQTVNQETYQKGRIDRRLLPQISFEWKWFVLVKAHYSNIVQDRLTENKRISDLFLVLTIHQAPSVEIVRTVVERKVYGNNWEARNIDHLVKRIKRKAKEVD